MKHQMTNFSSAHGFELPRQGQFHTMPSEFIGQTDKSNDAYIKPYLISAEKADHIVKVLAVVSLFCALFLIGLNA